MANNIWQTINSNINLPLILSIISLIIIQAHYSKMAKSNEFGDIPNNVIHEKSVIKVFNKTLIVLHYIEIDKLVARNTVRLNFSVTFTKPVDNLWMQGILYYKYQQYQRFLVNAEAEFCQFVTHGLFTSPYLRILLDNFWTYIEGFEIDTDMEPKCPFSGTVTVFNPSFNVSHITIPLLPAGRYRWDVYYRMAKNGPLQAAFQFFFRISDLRVWF